MDRFVTLHGLQTRYREEGQGPAVILLHGASLGSSLEAFEPNMAPLAARGLRALALEWPGYGLTPMVPEYSAALRRDHVTRFMDALNVDKATLVGHSMSGGVAVQLAFDRPDRVAKVGVLGSGNLLPPLPDKPGREAGVEPTAEPTLEETRADLEATTFDHSRLTQELIERRHELSTGVNFEAAKARAALPPERAGGQPLWQRVEQIPVPAIFI